MIAETATTAGVRRELTAEIVETGAIAVAAGIAAAVVIAESAANEAGATAVMDAARSARPEIHRLPASPGKRESPGKPASPGKRVRRANQESRVRLESPVIRVDRVSRGPRASPETGAAASERPSRRGR